MIRHADNLRRGVTTLLLALSLCVAPGPMIGASERVTVFAAASLTDAMREMGKAWQAKAGQRIRLSFASSSTLAKQIEAGAPAQIFMSADEAWMDYLQSMDLIEISTRNSPISNELVLIAPREFAPKVRPVLQPGMNLLGFLGNDGRLALGDPDHVPAGRYAQQSLRYLGEWTSLTARLARADNVRTALAMVARGETPLGIVYKTDVAAADNVVVLGTFPEQSHAPIRYPFAVLKGQRSAATDALMDFMCRGDGLEVFARFGFIVGTPTSNRIASDSAPVESPRR